MTYNDFLKQSALKCGNILCMGLDPVIDALPYADKAPGDRITAYFTELLSAMKERGLTPAAFKPNIGYYSCLDRPMQGDFSGSLALASVIKLVREIFPGTPLILDAKRGDIATSSLNYAKEAFDAWGADCVTVSPYMGTDSVMPFSFENKGMYILNRTSNPGGAVLQNRSSESGMPFYLIVSAAIGEWNQLAGGGIGAVVGATNLTEFEEIAGFFSSKNIPLLIPGVGSQGGTAPEVMDLMKKAGYPLYLARINSSSGLTHPWKKAPVPENYIEVCLGKIEKLLGETAI